MSNRRPQLGLSALLSGCVRVDVGWHSTADVDGPTVDVRIPITASLIKQSSLKDAARTLLRWSSAEYVHELTEEMLDEHGSRFQEKVRQQVREWRDSVLSR